MDDLLAAALRERRWTLPPAVESGPLLTAAAVHGVLPLIAQLAQRHQAPVEVAGELRRAAAAEAALAMARECELVRVLEALHDAGVDPLLIKGAHLAFAYYDSPDLRPRADTDLLIQDVDRQPVRGRLAALGYEPLAHVTGDVAFTQFHFTRTDAAGVRHVLDVHWRISGPRAFADRLGWAELHGRRIGVPRLGANAFGPCTADALLIACMHRTAHHRNSDRLIWLYDILVLSAALTEADWRLVLDLCGRTGLSAVVAAGIRASGDRLGTRAPDDVRRELDGAAVDSDVRAFLDGSLSPVGVAMSDLRRLPGWRLRSAFVREHLFPPRAYIRAKYRVDNPAVLPFLYLRRAVSAAGRSLFSRSAAPGPPPPQ